MAVVAMSFVCVRVVMVMVVRMSVGRHVGVTAVHGALRSAEQTAGLRRFEEIHDLGTGREAEGDVFKMMCVHDRIHDEAVHRHGHVHEAVLYNGWPVLVAEGMSELDAALDELIGGQLLEAAQIDDKHLTQVDFADDGLFRFFVPKEDVAVVQERVAVKGYRDGLSIAGILAEPVFLSVPLAEFECIDGGVGKLGLPRGIVAVAKYIFYKLHGFSFIVMPPATRTTGAMISRLPWSCRNTALQPYPGGSKGVGELFGSPSERTHLEQPPHPSKFLQVGAGGGHFFPKASSPSLSTFN